MRWLIHSFLSLLSLTPVFAQAGPVAETESPAFSNVPELMSSFRLLYIQKFPEARAQFTAWESQHPGEPFGEVCVAASYLFEEFYRQGVLTSDFFLNEKRFLHGIEGNPDPELMQGFDDAIRNTRKLAAQRLAKNPADPEGLFALTLSAGMESDADMILKKHNLEALKRLKEANGHAKTLLALRHDAQDAYVALGSANYIIGSLNAGFRAMLWFGGVHGDKKLGMEQVAKTVEGGRYLKPFAKIMLALAARREKQNPLAQKLLRELTEEFPESPLYAAEYAKAMGRPIPAQMVHP
jgi:tetratricopeptide (TPR) repeat protein